MTTELIKRLRSYREEQCIGPSNICTEAADALEAMQRELDAAKAEIERLSRLRKDDCQEIDTKNREIDRLNAVKLSRFGNEDCWIYQGDGEDHLESLACPVVIRPAVLIEMQKQLAARDLVIQQMREVLRKSYVELFHCDQQMTHTLDEDGEPLWTTGKTVFDSLAESLAVLELQPSTSALDAYVAEKVKEEREANARLCDEHKARWPDAMLKPLSECAAAIRARSNKENGG